MKKIFQRLLILAFFVIFPFGNLLSWELVFGLKRIVVQPIDLIVGASALYAIIFVKTKPVVSKQIEAFLIIAGFSLLVFTSTVGVVHTSIGALYFVRLVAYYYFLVFLIHSIENQEDKQKVYIMLILSLVIVAVFGWIQYLYSPDLRWMKVYGWDDHMGRLTGTFFDPGFTGIVLTFGAILSYLRFHKHKTLKFALLALAFALTVLFTYSRASYLALLSGFIFIIFSVKSISKIQLSKYIVVFFFLITILPRGASEGVKLERLFSIRSRVTNYFQTLEVWRHDPLFGVGFNNLCYVRATSVNSNVTSGSHSCSGSDSSIALILSTTGVIGLMIFVNVVVKVYKSTKQTPFELETRAVLIALGVHSLINNSIFYPWVLGVLVTVLALTYDKKKLKRVV